MTKLTETLQETLGSSLPGVLGALGILIIGWFVAIAIRAGVRKGLGFLQLNTRLGSTTGTQMDVEGGTATALYYLALLFVLVGFFNALDLEVVSGPLRGLLDQVLAFVPKIVAGGVLMLVAWVLATVVRTLVSKALQATNLDDKLSSGAGMSPMSDHLGNVLFWLIILLFLPVILGTLELDGLLAPVQGMVNEILGMLPNVFGALIIGGVGWFVAKIVRDLVSNLLTAGGADGLGEQVGLRGTMSLSHLVGLVVYILILVPALIAALQALNIEVITVPATEMLDSMMSAIPNIFAAAIILAVAFFVSRLISHLISNLLGGMGFDQLPAKIGIGQIFEGGVTPSQLVGKVLVFFIMLFATVEAANRLGFGQLSELVAMFVQFGGQVLLGSAIIGVGFWLSNLAYEAIRRVEGSGVLSGIARFAILGLVIAMGLRAMGLADDIVNLAFGLTLGAIAIAVALSFGLGGREAAGKQMEHWLGRLRGER
ncbi:MAG: mechanosensitive ion channel [Nitrospirales bacterium]